MTQEQTLNLITTKEELKAELESNDQFLRLFHINVQLLESFFLNGNSKLHNLSDLEESIDRHKFADPIKFDQLAPNGTDDTGAISEGNGRLELIAHMRQAKRDIPKGIYADEEERWYMPVLLGADSDSEEDAIAYSISHNLSAFWGSNLDFSLQATAFDTDALKAQLEPLQQADLLPIGIDEDGADLLLGVNFDDYDDDEGDEDDQMDDYEKGVKRSIQIEFMPDDYDRALEVIGFWRKQDVYVGGKIMEYLEHEKDKVEEEGNQGD